MTYKQIIDSLKKGNASPVYFLHGEEDHYIDEVSKYIENNILTEDEKSFNMTIMYGKDSDFKHVLDAARRYPVMASKQVVIIKEAQDLKTIDNLEPYLENPLESTVLVFAHKHKTLDKRKKFGKTLDKAEKAGKAVVFESKKLYENEIPDWIMDYLKDQNVRIDPDAAQLLAEYLGNDLSKIANELGKLLISLPKGNSISRELIQLNIGASKDYDVFELQAALADRNAVKSYKIAQYYMANPKSGPLPMVTGILYGFFSKAYVCAYLPNKYDETYAKALGQKLYGPSKPGSMSKRYMDYRNATKQYSYIQLEKILMLLKEYDLRSKGVGLPFVGDEFNEATENGELLREMVIKILGV
jgi:DNA polymerase-3 subunit delta